VKAQKPTPLIVLLLAAAALFALAACSPVEPSHPSSVSNDARPAEPIERPAGDVDHDARPVEVLTSSGSAPANPREGMVAFEGNVFVATTELDTGLWQSAGWSIGQDPVSTDPADLQADCTLYPHAGVENQWVGRCRGYILIPQAGARDIAVMVTDESGGTMVVQVAPPPTGVQP
jgi:hypothetical protein